MRNTKGKAFRLAIPDDALNPVDVANELLEKMKIDAEGELTILLREQIMSQLICWSSSERKTSTSY